MSTSLFLQNQRNQVNHFNYYFYRNAFTEAELEKIHLLGDSYPKQQAVTGGGENTTASDYRVSEISWIPEVEDTEWLYRKMANYAMEANKEMWNFDIWGYHDSFQYTTYYGDGGHYDWHADLGPQMSNRKLSCVLQLSEPTDYEGGDLEMNPGGQIISVPREKRIIMFLPIVCIT